MPIEITMPRLSDTMEVGTVIRWNVKEGDTVSPGDVLADIETDKATMELESFDEGTVARVVVGEGETVNVGQVIAVLAEEDEDTDSIQIDSGKGPEPAPKKKAPADKPDRTEPEPRTDRDASRVFASPLARKLAAEHNLDLTDLEGSGPSGRIVRKDVEAALARVPEKTRPEPAGRGRDAARQEPPSPRAPRLEARRVSLSNMRRTIARRLVESSSTIPHYQVTVEVDAEPLLVLRSQLNEQLADQDVKLSVNDFIIRACALAMHRHSSVNSRWAETDEGAAIDLLDQVNIGVAVAVGEERGGGLVVATLRGTDHLGLRQISAQSRALAEKARTKGLTLDEMADSTFTVSNLGMFGVAHFTAIINPPNTAILAVGTAVARPVVRDGQVVPGRVMSMTMSSDHRVIDGAMAARYLATVKDYLEKPATLLV